MSSVRMMARFYAVLMVAGPVPCLVAASVTAAAAQAPLTRPDPYAARQRVVVMTDIANEPDDQMSMVRFLLYSNQLDIEGLVATTSTWMKARVHPDVIHKVLDAYEQVQPNLLKHAPGFPPAAALRAVVAPGQPDYGMAAVGPDKSSPGAALILRAADRDDPRPLWLLAWGGTNTLAQALLSARASRSPEQVEALVSKLRVYAISDQDDAGPWLRREFPALRYIASPSTQDGEQYYFATWTGISGDRFYRNAPGADFTTFTDEWVNANIRAKGPLGKLYPFPCCIHEGDTPTFLGLIDNGLASAMSPAYGGWGGRYVWRRPSGETRPFWTQGGDSYPGNDSSRDTVTGTDGRTYTSDQATIWRWRTAFQNDFAARMDWTTRAVSEANHAPQVVVNGVRGTEPVVLHALVGTPITLDASGTTDPDGNALTYTWFFYPEAGTGIPGQPVLVRERPRAAPAGQGGIPPAPSGGPREPAPRIVMENAGGPRAVVVPKAAGIAHVILAVEDNGTPHLTAYRRVIVEMKSMPASGAGAHAGPEGPASERAAAQRAAPIDREALVARHPVVLRSFDTESPLSVGNGEFAFTVDATGLQTFPDAFEQTIPLGTLSQWGWHTSPNPGRWSMDTFHYRPFDSHGRAVGYADIPADGRTPEIDWLRANPHRLHLGRIGFQLTKADGTRARPADLSDIEQTLDLWTGVIRSRFLFDGATVTVRTLCHPSLDALAVHVTSDLVRDGRLAIDVRFPYGTGETVTADWAHPDAHETVLSRPRAGGARFARTLDADSYQVDAAWVPASASLQEVARHAFVLTAGTPTDTLEFTAWFTPSAGADTPVAVPPAYPDAEAAATEHWRRFWTTGGAIDLSGSRDARWRELERRIILSRYLTAIQCAGSLPPQETGLTYNSWEGKFHLEMHWWHGVHFAAWDRFDLLDRSLDYYARVLPRARETATRQGYAGARWPKMTDPRGVESPSSIGPFLAWQQPHPIYYAELAYRAHGDRATLDRFATVVSETAAFMASFVAWDDARGRYVLGPPLQCAQERFPKDRTSGCAFELAYWRWGLETAQNWRTRRGLERDAQWDRVLARLDEPAVSDGRYLFANSEPDSYTDPRWTTDHPTVLASLGVLPGPRADRETMRRTLDWVWANWTWSETWGWDYPMIAMTAARVGEPELAVDALLRDAPRNQYRANGHNHQRPGLTVYLPGNGGLLTAVAMMAAGWDGAPNSNAPGFPDNGQWSVRWEGLRRLP